jgi:hypothetical protein
LNGQVGEVVTSPNRAGIAFFKKKRKKKKKNKKIKKNNNKIKKRHQYRNSVPLILSSTSWSYCVPKKQIGPLKKFQIEGKAEQAH